MLNLSAQVTKVEPPFWWEEMKNSSLMITLYGENLHQYDVNSEQINIVDVVQIVNFILNPGAGCLLFSLFIFLLASLLTSLQCLHNG